MLLQLKTTVFYFLDILKCNSFMWQRLFFSSHYANLESHDHMILQLSNMLANMYRFLFLSVSKTPVRVNIFVETIFFPDSLINIKLKRTTFI